MLYRHIVKPSYFLRWLSYHEKLMNLQLALQERDAWQEETFEVICPVNAAI